MTQQITDVDPALDPQLDHLSRRTFLKRAGTAAAAATALGEAAAAEDDPGKGLTDPNLLHDNITFPSGNTLVEGYLTAPRTEGSRGSVIVIHEIFGLTDHIKDVASRVASAGYTALAPNFFTREGKPPEGFDSLMPFVNKIPDSQIEGDIQAVVEYLRKRPHSNGKVGLVGFCWGGYYAWLSSAEVSHLAATVAYYGRIRLPEKTANKPESPMDLVPRVHAAVMGHYGVLDRGIPVADAEALRDELKKHHKTAEIYTYEGAGHAFNNDTRESYNADAAKLAWSRTLDWFHRYL